MKKEQEFSVGDIVFYPKSIHEMTRHKKNANKEYVAQVDWGAFVVKCKYGISLTRYSVCRHTTIDGVPILEWHERNQPEPWHTIPKTERKRHITYAEEEMYRRCSRDFNAEYFAGLNLSSLDFAHKAKELIENGELVSKDKEQYRIDTEFDGLANDKYRLVCKFDSSAYDPTNIRVLPEHCFHTYEEALTQAKAICAAREEADRCFAEMNFLEDVDWLCSKLPEKYQSYKTFFLQLPHNYGCSFRYYRGEVLYRGSRDEAWTILLKTEE